MLFSAHFGQPEMCDNSKYDLLEGGSPGVAAFNFKGGLFYDFFF